MLNRKKILTLITFGVGTFLILLSFGIPMMQVMEGDGGIRCAEIQEWLNAPTPGNTNEVEVVGPTYDNVAEEYKVKFEHSDSNIQDTFKKFPKTNSLNLNVSEIVIEPKEMINGNPNAYRVKIHVEYGDCSGSGNTGTL